MRVPLHQQWLFGLAAMAAAWLAGPAAGQGVSWEAVEARSLRLASVSHRLLTSNAPLCTERQPGHGMVLLAIDQFAPADRGAVAARFGAGAAMVVETVVPGSPAARAGVLPGDTLLRVNAISVPPIDRLHLSSSTRTRDALADAIAAEPADAALDIAVLRNGARQQLRLAALASCRSEVELVDGDAGATGADGHTAQLGDALLERLDDDALAVVLAHELSHNILHHRARLAAAGVRRGIAAQFGRNARLLRAAEAEADRLSVHLLRNAGYDPALAVGFWRGQGRALGGMRGPTHPAPDARARQIAAEIATIPAAAPVPFVPPLLAVRARPIAPAAVIGSKKVWPVRTSEPERSAPLHRGEGGGRAGDLPARRPATIAAYLPAAKLAACPVVSRAA